MLTLEIINENLFPLWKIFFFVFETILGLNTYETCLLDKVKSYHIGFLPYFYDIASKAVSSKFQSWLKSFCTFIPSCISEIFISNPIIFMSLCICGCLRFSPSKMFLTKFVFGATLFGLCAELPDDLKKTLQDRNVMLLFLQTYAMVESLCKESASC